MTDIIDRLEQKLSVIAIRICFTYRCNRYCLNLSNCELGVVENYYNGWWPTLLQSTEAEGFDNNNFCGLNCYKICDVSRGRLPGILPEEIRNLRHVFARRNDRTSHVHHRVPYTELMRIRTFYSGRQVNVSGLFWSSIIFFDLSYFLEESIQKHRITIDSQAISVNFTLSFHCRLYIITRLFIVFSMIYWPLMYCKCYRIIFVNRG